MFGQKNWLIIYLKPHELEIFVSHLGTVSTLPIPFSIINNLEILDRDALYSLISSWVKTLAYIETSIVWLLSPETVFEQSILDSDKDHFDTLTVQFLDSVPFEEVLSKVYSPPGARLIVATNADLITALTQAFNMHGYTTSAVVSAKSYNIHSPLTQDAGKHILASLSKVQQDSLVLAEESNNLSTNPVSQVDVLSISQPKPKSSLPLLLGVFGALLAILIIVIYLNQ